MKKLSLAILLLALLCCAVFFTACGTSDACKDGHTAATDAAVAPTCTETGLTEGSHCSVCEAVITAQEKVPATGHTKSDWINDKQAKPCTEDGTRHKECTVCNAVLEVGTITSTGHDFGDWETVTAATCTQQGSKKHTCSICGAEESDVIPITHTSSNTWQIGAAATCTEDGFKYKTCTSCGIVTSEQVISATGHTDAGATVIPATCTADGSKTGHCSTCNQDFTEVLTKLGHDLPTTWTTVLAATCNSAGTETRTCNRTGCEYTEQQVVPQLTHTAGSWITDLAATCGSSGSRHTECQHCHEVMQTEVIDALNHSAGSSWIVEVAPTATTAGTSKQVCVTCGTTLRSASNSLNLDAIVVGALSTQNLANYTIVYANSCKQNNKLYTYINGTFKNAVSAAAGKATVKSESDVNDSPSSKQILIGITSREQSQRALSSLQGRGFTIRVDGNKIVILGTDDLLTMSALQYFVNNYLAGAGKNVSINEDVTAAGLPVVALSSAYGSSFAYVFDADWDIDPYHMYVTDSYNNNTGAPGDGREYPVYVYEYLMNRISQLSGLPVANFTSVADTDKTYVNGYELLFSTVDRAESRAFRDTLDANQYGFRIVGNKVILANHIDAALEPLVQAFLEFYTYAMEYNGGVLPQGYEEVYTLQTGDVKGPIIGTYKVPAWKLDFPRPENTHLEMAEDNNDNAIQLVYTGTGASVSGFEAYCATLVAQGYTLVNENNNPGNTGSYFRLYKHAGKQIVLYVAFDAFTYQDGYAARYASENVQYGDFIHYTTVNSGQDPTQYPMRTYQQCIRIVSSSTSDAFLPDTKLMSQQKYTKVCNSTITTIRYICSSVGMGYILQLEDGSFVIVDGGNSINSCTSHPNDHHDTEVLYHTLVSLFKECYGTDPSASNPIHIKAWLVTHSHGDHYGNMNSFLNKYTKEKLIKMDYLVGNFPDESTIYPVAGDTIWMGNGNIAKMQKYFTDNGLTAFKYVKVHTGMKLYFANLKMEILMTTEDHAPFRITNSNDTNTVTKWTITHTAEASGSISATTANNAKKTTWTMLGDSCIYASRWLCAMWGGTYNSAKDLYDGGYLKADMVQLAHHGNIGCEIAMYKTVQAKILWFPHNSNSYNGYTQNGNKENYKPSWTRTVDNYAVNECPTVEYVIVSGLASGGTNSVTLSFNADGLYLPASGNPAWGIKCTFLDGKIDNVNYKVAIGYNTVSGNRKITYAETSPVIKK